MLTIKQKRILDFIKSHTAENAVSPSFREIQAALGLKSVSTVTYYVRMLTNAGYLANTKGYHGKRGLQVIDHLADTTHDIPLMGRIAAGFPIEPIEDRETVEVPSSLAAPGNYALKVQGDSMIGDGVLDQDVVIVRQVDTARHREMVVALINGEATLKRLMQKGGKTALHPANPDYPVIDIGPEDDFRIQGVAIGVIRRF